MQMRLPSTLDVWVVDDEPAMLSVVERALSATEYRVHCFSSARQVRSELRRSTPGVVVADLLLGDEDGLELINYVRESAWPAPAVLISGSLNPALSVKAMRSGCMAVLEKPFRIPILCQEVETAYGQAMERAESLRRQMAAADAWNDLSPGHRDVLNLLIECRPHKQIARELGIALRTVEKRKKDAFERLGIETFTNLLQIMLLAQVVPQGLGDPQSFPMPSMLCTMGAPGPLQGPHCGRDSCAGRRREYAPGGAARYSTRSQRAV